MLELTSNFTALPADCYPEKVIPILSAILDVVHPETSVKDALYLEGEFLTVDGRKYDLSLYDHVYLIGFGKASISMARGVKAVLGEHLTEGRIIAKTLSTTEKLDNITLYQGSHPVPTEKSVEGTKKLVELVSGLTGRDLVICVVSGGGSALFTYPHDGILLEELQSLTSLLLKSGADINEMNTIRKHIDRVKGGGLAEMIFPASLITLVLSDVIGNPLESIASGPTTADTSTYGDCIAVLEKYHLVERAPQSIIDHLNRGSAGEIRETLKVGSPVIASVQNIIIGSNYKAASAGMQMARQIGFNSQMLTTYLSGEASHIGQFLSSILKEICGSGHPIPRPACIIVGGETTVTVHGGGKGGRNQEVAAGAVRELAGLKDVAMITFATDGEDGPTDAAGAIISGDTYQEGIDLDLSLTQALAENDTYYYFARLNRLLITGPTGTNVNDITLLFAF